MNYIYYNEFGKEIKKSLSPIAKGSSGIKIYIFSDFDNSSETEYEVSASFKKADGFVAGDIFLPLSSNTKINPYNQQAMYYRELTIGNDVTDIVGGLQLSIRYIQTNVIVVDPETDPPVTYEEKVIHVTGMVTFNIYDATSFISPPQNTALINLKNYLLNYIDTQDANIFEVDRTFLQSLGVTNNLTVGNTLAVGDNATFNQDVTVGVDLTAYGTIFAEGGLDSRAKKIINVAPPENPLDAVNKSYADTALITKENLINKITEWGVSPTDDQYPSAKLVKDYLDDNIYTKTDINTMLSATYKPKGTITGTELLAITPSSENEGFVYNISTEFTTTIAFIEGAGITHIAGENVVIVENTEGVYKFDVLSGFVDLSSYALKTDIKEDKEDVVFQATSLDSLTSGQKTAITTQVDDVLTSGEIDKEKFKNFILEITLTGNKYYYQCVQYFMINGIATLYFASTQTTGIIKLYVDTLTPANSTLTNHKYYDGIQASDSSFSGPTTNYLQDETNVDEAIKELDTQVKATNDSIPDISLNDNTATEGKYISKLEVDSVDLHKINITKADLPTIPTVTNDLTDDLKENYDDAYTHSQTNHAPSNAEQNVQSDWNQTVDTEDDFIKNKPSIPSKTSDLTNDSGFATETYVNNKVSSVYKIKGSVADYSSLPTENLTVGDVYNLLDTGDNYVWDGTAWDKLSGTVDLSGYVEKDGTKVLSDNNFTTTLKNKLDGAEITSNKVTAWSEAPNDTRYPSESLVKNSLDAINVGLENIGSLSPLRFAGYFTGGTVVNDFNNLIRPFENLTEALPDFYINNIKGAMFVCNAASDFVFNTVYTWVDGVKTTPITFNWAAPYDEGIGTVNFEVGDTISILNFAYDTVENEMFILVKVEKSSGVKADKVIPASTGNIPKLNASGNLEDSGFKLEKSVPSNAVFTDTVPTDYVVKNTGITAATKPKITYDAKGLVTAGADLIADDIPALPITKITNLSTTLSSIDSDITALENTVAGIEDLLEAI